MSPSTPTVALGRSRLLPRPANVHTIVASLAHEPPALQTSDHPASSTSQPQPNIRDRHASFFEIGRASSSSPPARALYPRTQSHEETSVASSRSDSLSNVSFDSDSQRLSPVTPKSVAQNPCHIFCVGEHNESREQLLGAFPLRRGSQSSVEHMLDDEHFPSQHRKDPPLSSVSFADAYSGLGGNFQPHSDDFGRLSSPLISQDTRVPSPDISSIIIATSRPRLNSAPGGATYDEEDSLQDYGHMHSRMDSKGSEAVFPRPVAEEFDLTCWDERHDSDSGSEIDLHTSLPQLMLHHGYLSPRSKLLTLPSPVSSSGGDTSSSSQVPHDPRHTTNRSTRHREANVLRGGIGLTTGLGWSDSEDEDAPSALTKQVSTLDLSTRSLSRSKSHASLGSGVDRKFRQPSSYSTGSSRSTPTDVLRSAHDEFGIRPDNLQDISGRRGCYTGQGPIDKTRSRLPRYSRPSLSVPRTGAPSSAQESPKLGNPLLRTRSRVLRVMAADKQKPLPPAPTRLSTSSRSVSSSPIPERDVALDTPTRDVIPNCIAQRSQAKSGRAI
ncbi:unnamed protein product, partial [Mycena citricolor]